MELDDDPECNGLASRPSVEGRGPTEAFLMDSISPDEELKIVKSTVPSEIKLPSGNIMSKTSDFSCGAVMLGEGSSIITLPALEDATAAAPARTQKTNNPLPLVSFSSEVADEFLLLTSGSISRMPETKQESFSRFVIACKLSARNCHLVSSLKSFLSPNANDLQFLLLIIVFLSGYVSALCILMFMFLDSCSFWFWILFLPYEK